MASYALPHNNWIIRQQQSGNISRCRDLCLIYDNWSGSYRRQLLLLVTSQHCIFSGWAVHQLSHVSFYKSLGNRRVTKAGPLKRTPRTHKCQTQSGNCSLHKVFGKQFHRQQGKLWSIRETKYPQQQWEKFGTCKIQSDRNCSWEIKKKGGAHFTDCCGTLTVERRDRPNHKSKPSIPQWLSLQDMFNTYMQLHAYT